MDGSQPTAHNTIEHLLQMVNECAEGENGKPSGEI